MRALCLGLLAVSLVINCPLGLGQSDSPAVATSSAIVERRAAEILKKLTLEEKIDLLGGVDGFFIRSIERLKLPRIKMADGPVGVRNFGPATSMAAGIALAASWNTVLAEEIGREIGRDARAKGVHVLLAPGVNIYRAPMNGRNFEYFGEDPFLAARISVGYIKGVQSQGVSATIKHFMGNNSEFDRHNVDSVIDERTMREIYLPAFEAAVKEARVGAVMDAYNLTNGVHMTENTYLNSDVLKKEWGFDGILMSDWSSTYDGIAAANSGMDLEMPSGQFMNRETLIPAIKSGKVSEATIDDKVLRILRKTIEFGWIDREQTDISIPRYNQQGRRAALLGAREGMVLLKNDRNLLPLNKQQIKSIAVIGPNAHPAQPAGGGSAHVRPFGAISFLEGVSNYLGSTGQTYFSRGLPTLIEMALFTSFTTAEKSGEPGLTVEYFETPDLRGNPLATRVESSMHLGPSGGFISFFEPTATSTFGIPDKWTSVRFTGYFTPTTVGAHEVLVQAPGDGNGYRLYIDDKLVLDQWLFPTAIPDFANVALEATPHKVKLEYVRWQNRYGLGGMPRIRLAIVPHHRMVQPQATAIAAKADAVVLALGHDLETESEANDRTFRLPPGQEQLIREIAAVNKNIIVALTSGGAVDMRNWLDSVSSVIQVWYPGQEGGTALAEVLFGDVNPSGRLPVTFERRWEDNPVHDSYYPAAGTKRVEYKEGVFVGYRGYEKKGVKPLYPFGHGLSYTNFKYQNLSVRPAGRDASNGSEPRFEVSFDIQNTGSREGADVAQVYVGDSHTKLPRPSKELKGFVKVNLRPGETKRVSVPLDGRAFAYYDAGAKQWRAEPGDFTILIGRSSEQIELRGNLTLTASQAAAIK